ncbi:MAG: ATP12 family protein [Alphaproteobacteria bacterium]
MKRFYTEAAVRETSAGAYCVALDGRVMRTPGRELLSLPNRALAEAIVREWAEQPEKIDPKAMPMTRFANTAIDRVRPRRDTVVDEIAAYGETDLLCYRADGPESLAALQDEIWQPHLDWAAERYGARMLVTRQVLHVAQPPDSLSVLRDAVAQRNDFTLSALHTLTAILGSVVLALAVSERRLDAAAAAAASLVDELWQAEKWGHDHEAVSRRDAVQAEIASAARFLAVSEA